MQRRYAETGAAEVLDRFTAECVQRVVGAARELLRTFEAQEERAKQPLVR